jgi:mono/diheme cytochrome c family protein
MRAVRISTVVLAAAVAISPSLNAQTAPAPAIALPAGDAARGKAIFEGTKGNCLSCHQVKGIGSLFAPDLSAIGNAPPAGGGGRGGGGRGGAAAPAAPGANTGAAIPPPPPPAPAGANPQLLAQSILEPNAVVSPVNRYVILKMRDGKTITGKLLSVDTFAYQIFDSTEKLANITKDNVREATMTSPMPPYKDKLTTQELADVVSYLLTLKGQ